MGIITKNYNKSNREKEKVEGGRFFLI